MRRAGGFGLDKHLFVIKLEQVNLSELTSFYKSVLRAWNAILKMERDIDNTGQWVFEEPLFFNSLIRTRLLSSRSIQRNLLKHGVTKLGHLIKEDGWKSAEQLKDVTGLRSLRLVLKLKEEIEEALPNVYRTCIAQRHDNVEVIRSMDFPDLSIFPAIKEEEIEVVDTVLSFKTPQLNSFKEMDKKSNVSYHCKSFKSRLFKRTKNFKVA